VFAPRLSAVSLVSYLGNRAGNRCSRTPRLNTQLKALRLLLGLLLALWLVPMAPCEVRGASPSGITPSGITPSGITPSGITPSETSIGPGEQVGSLKILPEILHTSERYPAQVAVLLVGSDGAAIDVTGQAQLTWEAQEPELARFEAGRWIALKTGTTQVTARFEQPSGSIAAQATLHVASDSPVAFDREVISTLTRSGCNLGTCHGNLHGKGGFRLSLRGDDPTFDYYRLAVEFGQRRIDPFDPSKSLILTKATAALAHQGGKRFSEDSSHYKAILDWIDQGALQSSAPSVTSLEVFPANQRIVQGNRLARIIVQARFADGTVRDVTSWSRLEPSLPSGVEVRGDGTIEVEHAMDLSIGATYLDGRSASRIVFLGDSSLKQDSGLAQGSLAREIEHPYDHPYDRTIAEQSEQLQISLADRADDGMFIRRLFLATVGRLPSPEETLEYLADPSPMRNDRWIDQLLADPGFDYAWAMRWSDLVRNEDKVMSSRGASLLHEWLREQIASDRPLQEWVGELVSSLGSTYENPPASFYRTHRDAEVAAESSAQVFLGVRIACAKCHNHPFDRWKQDDYYGLAAHFTTLERKQIDNKPKDALDKHVITGDEVISLSDKKPQIKHPGRSKMVGPSGLGSVHTQIRDASATQELEPQQSRTVLQEFASWLTLDNRQFDANLANRIWYQYFGRGIVEPPDDFRESNPPSNPELLEQLATDMRAEGYSLKRLSRNILASSTFARASIAESSDENLLPTTPYFASYPLRRLAAEPLIDAISEVTGVPSPLRTGDEDNSTVYSAMRMPGIPKKPGFLTTFGKPNRLLVCECERSSQISLGQSLAMTNGVEIRDKIAAPSNRLDGYVEQLQLHAKGDISAMSPERVIEELFLRALSRKPSQRELRSSLDALEPTANSDRAAVRVVLEDLLWALLNSKEFMMLR
jgi:hypothetical protein